MPDNGNTKFRNEPCPTAIGCLGEDAVLVRARQCALSKQPAYRSGALEANTPVQVPRAPSDSYDPAAVATVLLAVVTPDLPALAPLHGTPDWPALILATPLDEEQVDQLFCLFSVGASGSIRFGDLGQHAAVKVAE
jgi:hypothetical protein